MSRRDFQTVYDEYLSTLDTVQCLEHDEEMDGYAPGLDDARCQLTDLRHELVEGKYTVTCDADFNGRTREVTGVLIGMVDDKCYVKAAIGNVEGDATSLTDAT